MSFHIEAKSGEIAETVLLPGDPLRAKYIAENYLDNPICYNNIRAMYGYTGYYKGKKVSVQGTGMGVPSIAIYSSELVQDYSVKKLIRIGTCGSIQQEIQPNDIILAISASSNSSFSNLFIENGNFAPCADFQLLKTAYEIAKKLKVNVFAGNVLTSDIFYHFDHEEYWKKWADYGILALEMETSGLYTIAARLKAEALSILTVSDTLFSEHKINSQDKERNLGKMVEIALQLV